MLRIPDRCNKTHTLAVECHTLLYSTILWPEDARGTSWDTGEPEYGLRNPSGALCRSHLDAGGRRTLQPSGRPKRRLRRFDRKILFWRNFSLISLMVPIELGHHYDAWESFLAVPDSILWLPCVPGCPPGTPRPEYCRVWQSIALYCQSMGFATSVRNPVHNKS